MITPLDLFKDCWGVASALVFIIFAVCLASWLMDNAHNILYARAAKAKDLEFQLKRAQYRIEEQEEQLRAKSQLSDPR